MYIYVMYVRTCVRMYACMNVCKTYVDNGYPSLES